MKIINIWISVINNAVNTLKSLSEDPNYTGQHLSALNLFHKVSDISTIEKLFKSVEIGENVWHLYSVIFQNINIGELVETLEYLKVSYPNYFRIEGAWWWDGRQIGTYWIDEDNHDLGVTGSPIYPISIDTLINYMPESEITDVNLLQGQSPRNFQ